MVRRSYSELSKAAFISLYCAIVIPPLDNAIETNLIANTNHHERAQRLAARPQEERLCYLSLFSLERRRLWAALILAFKIFKSKVGLTPPDFFLRSTECNTTEYCEDQTIFKEELVREILEQIAGVL